MNSSSSAKEKNPPKNETEKNSPDPFASDIFAGSRLEDDFEPEVAPAAEAEKPPTWIWRLPKAARPTVDWNNLRRNLPPDFSADLPRELANSLAQCLNFDAENPIEFLFLVERETNGIAETENNSWWLNIGIETGEAGFAVEIDDVFAVWLVDAMLGDKKSDNVQIREFTPSEIAVLEFIAVNLVYEANKIIRAPLFRFRGLSRKVPDSISPTNDSENHLLIANWQTVHGFLNSIVKVYVTPEILYALDASENSLLTAAPRRRTNQNSFQNRVKDVRARLFLGAAQMTLADVAGLETNDVILPENYNFSAENGNLTGSAEIFLGDGGQVRLSGFFVPSEIDLPTGLEETDDIDNSEILVRRVKSNHVLRIVVNRFDEPENPRLLEKSMSNEEIESIGRADGEDAGGENEDGNGIALENLAVTLRVELEARRLSLAEVGSLRIDQVIELGVSAVDPVNLLIDDKVVARGELVEVENRLGVRIVQILR